MGTIIRRMTRWYCEQQILACSASIGTEHYPLTLIQLLHMNNFQYRRRFLLFVSAVSENWNCFLCAEQKYLNRRLVTVFVLLLCIHNKVFVLKIFFIYFSLIWKKKKKNYLVFAVYVAANRYFHRANNVNNSTFAAGTMAYAYGIPRICRSLTMRFSLVKQYRIEV